MGYFQPLSTRPALYHGLRIERSGDTYKLGRHSLKVGDRLQLLTQDWTWTCPVTLEDYAPYGDDDPLEILPAYFFLRHADGPQPDYNYRIPLEIPPETAARFLHLAVLEDFSLVIPYTQSFGRHDESHLIYTSDPSRLLCGKTWSQSTIVGRYDYLYNVIPTCPQCTDIKNRAVAECRRSLPRSS